MKKWIEFFDRQLERMFFGKTPQMRLEHFRAVFPIFAILSFLWVPWDHWADLPSCLWNPPGFTKLVMQSPPSLGIIYLGEIGFIVANLLLAFGRWPRIASGVAAAILGLLVGTVNAPLLYDRSANPMTLTYLILAATPELGRLTLSREKQWPIRLIQFNFFITFFAAGISKLARSGWSWTAADNLIAKWNWAGAHLSSNKLLPIQDYFHDQLSHLHGFAHEVAVAVLALEIGSLAFFLSPVSIIWGALVLALFQTTVFLTMYIPFSLFIPLYVVFLPLERLSWRPIGARA